MKQPTRVALLLLLALVAGCDGQAATAPTTAAPTSAPTAPAATTAPMTGTMTMDIGATPTLGATPAFTATEAMTSSMDMGGASGTAESYGSSIAAALPPATVDLSAFPVTVENCGRKLTFAKPPERVVGLWQASNELLLALGVQDRVVALAGNYTALPSDLADASKTIKTIGSAMTWPSKEVLLSERPDLVLSEGLEGYSFDASQGSATVAEIEATGANVLATGGNCTPDDSRTRATSTQVVFDDLAMLGTVFGVSARADALIEKLKAKEAEITANVAGKPPVNVAFYNGGKGPVLVMSFGIWADLMKKAGGEDVLASALPAGGYEVSVEAFATAQPDVILVGYYPGQDPQASIAFLKQTFPNIPAVQNNHFAPIPTIETEATVQVMDGLEKIARALHPEAFK